MYVGRCFMFWQDGTRALGTVMWGHPREADIEQMIPFFEVGAKPCFEGHASFVDGRRLESIDMLAFGKLLAYLTRRRHAWGPNIGRQAILHPSGFIGVVVAGALHVARPPYPFKSFEDDELGLDQSEGVFDEEEQSEDWTSFTADPGQREVVCTYTVTVLLPVLADPYLFKRIESIGSTGVVVQS